MVNFAQAPGIDGYTGNTLAVNYEGVRYIRFDIKSNYDGAIFDGTSAHPGIQFPRSITGLSEVAFEVATGFAAQPSASAFSDGEPTDFSVALNNAGGAVVSLSSATLSGADAGLFSVTSLSASLSGGASGQISLNFTAAGAAPGIYTATLTINSNDPLNPQTTVKLDVVVRDASLVITSFSRVLSSRIRIEFEGLASTAYQIRSSPDLSTSVFTGAVLVFIDGLLTNDIGNGRGKGFIEFDLPNAERMFYQIQSIVSVL